MEKLIVVSKKEWNKIPSDYKGRYVDYNNTNPELIGKRTVLSGCISKKIGTLLIEDIHFVIK